MNISQPLLITGSESEVAASNKIQKLQYSHNASLFSRLFFSWIATLLSFGNDNTIKQENLEELEQHERVEFVYEKWKNEWNYEKNKENERQPLKKSIFTSFQNQFLISFLFDFLGYQFAICTPLLIYFIATYLENQQKDYSTCWMLLIVTILVRFFRSYFDSHAAFRLTSLGNDISSSITLGMVKKAMTFSPLCNKKFKTGELANLLQVDCFRLSIFPKNISQVIMVIYCLIFAMVFMGILVGAAFLTGFGVILVAILMNSLLSRTTSKYQKCISEQSDNRMKQSNEIFSLIKFIKVNVWEEFFYDKLVACRKKEVSLLRKKLLIESVATFTMWLTPKMILAGIYGTFIAMDGVFTPPIAFGISSIFTYVQFYLNYLATSISIVIESYNSMKRIQNYLMAEEINISCITHNKYESTESKDAISVENGNFFWDRSEDETNLAIVEPTLNLTNLNFSIKKGEMVGVIGDVGSGKSSLIYSLLGELKFRDTSLERPKILINGTMSLVTQKPWLINDTVRNNIIFGCEFNRKKYQEVINQACLQKDLDLLISGDKTMIGEKGATLSGGQKARISFARALYSDSDILLMDDLLSAVDVHVGKFIMAETLLKHCKEKTRVLVTHALYFLKYVDKIIIMENGKIAEMGSYEKIRYSQMFQNIYFSMVEKKQRRDIQQKGGSRVPKGLVTLQLQETELLNQINESDGETEIALNKQDGGFGFERKEVASSTLVKLVWNKESGECVEDEAVSELLSGSREGRKGWQLFGHYVGYNGGWFFIAVTILLMMFWATVNALSNIWIAFWTQSDDSTFNSYYLNHYLIIAVVYGLTSSLRSLILAFSTPIMAEQIHQKMITKLIFAPLNTFFDRIPLGMIIQSLSQDLNTIDSILSNAFSNALTFLFLIIGTLLIVTFASSAYILIPILMYMFFCYLLQSYYMKPNQELSQLQSASRSPIISGFCEILSGLASIRAYGIEDSFFSKSCMTVNQNKKPALARKASDAWFTLRLTFLAMIINVSVLVYLFFISNIDPAMATLLFAAVLGYDQMTYHLLTNVSTFQNQLGSLQSCETFMKVNPEKGYQTYLNNRLNLKIHHIQKKKQASNFDVWPSRGKITFQNYKVKYRQNLDIVLKGISLTIHGGQKIGIVGRTGSGKSTIMLCLLRILEAHSGSITIDGKDISKLSLDDLRSKITIILQDPCLFAGSLRENLDPLNLYTDEELLKSIELCSLSEAMHNRRGLLTEISENGENFSVGQRQLISIARAILKPPKIILIDEATASIDTKTQKLIYKAINQAFKDCTVITIAHRLNTVVNSDRILVLESGLMKQFDSPKNLLENPNSEFYQMFKESEKENQM